MKRTRCEQCGIRWVAGQPDQGYGAWLEAPRAVVQGAALGGTRARLFREGGFRELHEEQDGKFVLKRDAIEGVKTQADLDRVNETLKK